MLRARGLVADVTSPDLESIVATRAVSVYCGFDPTAESLHLGNLLGIIVLSWFQRFGHRPVVLLGGATGRVGDPSGAADVTSCCTLQTTRTHAVYSVPTCAPPGKSAERPVLSEDVIERNVAGIEATLRSLLTSQHGTLQEPLVVNNLSWLGQMGFLQFLREVGKFARMGNMLSKDSVRTRCVYIFVDRALTVR